MRFFHSPRDDVFEAWTQPEHVSAWWDPEGAPLTACEIDLRAGGRFKFVTRGHPEMPFAGTYVEISAPERLVFDSNGAIGRVTLSESAGRTHMTVTIECASKDQFELYLKMRIDAGTGVTMDNLVDYVGRRMKR